MTPAEKLALLERMAATGDPEWVIELANYKRWGGSFPTEEMYAALPDKLFDMIAELPHEPMVAPKGFEDVPEFSGAVSCDDLLKRDEADNGRVSDH